MDRAHDVHKPVGDGYRISGFFNLVHHFVKTIIQNDVGGLALEPRIVFVSEIVSHFNRKVGQLKLWAWSSIGERRIPKRFAPLSRQTSLGRRALIGRRRRFTALRTLPRQKLK